MEYTIVHNPSGQRFEFADDPNAYVTYELNDTNINFTHTMVPPQWEGKGLGSSLVKTALDYAKANHYTIEADCPFVQIYLKRHPEYLL